MHKCSKLVDPVHFTLQTKLLIPSSSFRLKVHQALESVAIRRIRFVPGVEPHHSTSKKEDVLTVDILQPRPVHVSEHIKKIEIEMNVKTRV